MNTISRNGMRAMSGNVGAAIQNGIDFPLKLLFRLRVLAKKVKGPCQRQSGGFVSGKEKRHHLVADLALFRFRIFSVAAAQQDGKDVGRLAVVVRSFAAIILKTISSKRLIDRR